MNNFLKNKNYVIAAGVVIVLLLVGSYFFLFNKSGGSNQNPNAAPTEVPVLTIKPEEIGLTLSVSSDGHRATMKITQTEDISSVDYQLSYNADVDDQSVPRGTIGHVDVKNPGQTVSQDMIFGTCSDVCHFDSGVKDIKLIVKVTKSDGKVYQSEVSPKE